MKRQGRINGASETTNGSQALWEYVLTNTALIEQIGCYHYVYGLWRKHYGYWEINLSDNSAREFVPTWQLFNEKGIWLSQSQSRDLTSHYLESSIASKWLYEADIAFAAFFSQIPRQIRSLVACMGRHQGIALDLLHHEPALASILDEEIHQGLTDNFLSCLDLYQVEFTCRAERQQLARKMAENNSIEIFIL